MRVLVVNAGSSSLKLSVIEDGRRLQEDSVERWDGEEHLEPLDEFVTRIGPVEAVGHRIVHGGPRLTAATLVDDNVLDYLDSSRRARAVAQPSGDAGVRAARRVIGAEPPEVVCFDTSFHAGLPPAASTFALPREWNSSGACGATGSTGCATRMQCGGRRRWLAPGRWTCASCPATWAAAGSVAAVRRRAFGRHHHGLHAARGTGDGHSVGELSTLGLLLWLLQTVSRGRGARRGARATPG